MFISITFFNISLCAAYDKVQRFCTIWCHITNVINENIFVWSLIYFDVVQIKIFCTDHVMKKLARNYHNWYQFLLSYSSLYQHEKLLLDSARSLKKSSLVISTFPSSFYKNCSRTFSWFCFIQFANKCMS